MRPIRRARLALKMIDIDLGLSVLYIFGWRGIGRQKNGDVAAVLIGKCELSFENVIDHAIRTSFA